MALDFLNELGCFTPQFAHVAVQSLLDLVQADLQHNFALHRIMVALVALISPSASGSVRLTSETQNLQ
jgi:hypothetical protein